MPDKLLGWLSLMKFVQYVNFYLVLCILYLRLGSRLRESLINFMRVVPNLSLGMGHAARCKKSYHELSWADARSPDGARRRRPVVFPFSPPYHAKYKRTPEASRSCQRHFSRTTFYKLIDWYVLWPPALPFIARSFVAAGQSVSSSHHL